MAAIATTDVTYVMRLPSAIGESGYREFVFSLTFGDGALTYPANGVPLLKGSLGCPTVILDLEMVDPASSNGFVYKYDLVNNKIRIYQGDNDGVADGPLVELGTGATPAAATVIVKVRGY